MKNNFNIQERTFFQRLSTNLVFVVLALNIIGLINLYSATHGINTTETTSRLFFQQIIWILISWIIFFVLTISNYEFFRRASYLLYFLNIIVLAAVPMIGKSYYGAQRWIDLGFIRFQPSEAIKLSLILVLARLFSNKKILKKLDFKNLIFPIFFTTIPFVLIVRQPDLGTALLVASISLSMILFMKVKRSLLLISFIAFALAFPMTWKFGLKEYQKTRVLTFLYPGRDPRGSGYNSIQSKIAVGSGRILGKGFQKGTQSQLEFIPERHSDFIFSVLSEEYGFIGSLTTVGLFILLYVMCLRISAQARDRFGMLVSIGVLSMIFWHMFINIGMVIGLLPIVGVPLPLLSYGGSSLITVMAGLGLVSSVAYKRYLF